MVTIDQLLKGVKSTLLIPESVTTFDDALRTYVSGAKSYVDSLLDTVPNFDNLYILVIINISVFNWTNRDNYRVKNLPITVNSLLTRLKFKYSD